jgi:hypothetical protein
MATHPTYLPRVFQQALVSNTPQCGSDVASRPPQPVHTCMHAALQPHTGAYIQTERCRECMRNQILPSYHMALTRLAGIGNGLSFSVSGTAGRTDARPEL